jgi:SAM-dependent methyltransferase
MSLTLLDNPTFFRATNKNAWRKSWEYWYRKEYVHQGIREYFLDQLQHIKKEVGALSILDIGCGSGWCAKYYASLYEHYLGIDFNEKLITRLNTEFAGQEHCSFLVHDIESEDHDPVPISTGEGYDLILGSFILLELADLNLFFRKAAGWQKPGQYLVMTGLDPLNEIVRISTSQKDIDENLLKYRGATSPLVLSKEMSFNGDASKFVYYRILYSLNDVVSSAIRAGYEICEVNDELNKNSPCPDSPIYFSVRMRRRC